MSQNTLNRHSGACQNLDKPIIYSALASCVALPPASMQSWMLVASDSLSSAIAPALLYYCTSLYISRDISYIL